MRLPISAVLRPFSGCVPDRGDQPGDLDVVEADYGVAEVDRDVGAVLDEPAGEVVAVRERAVGGEQCDAGFEG
jgi:hypothetical protein